MGLITYDDLVSRTLPTQLVKIHLSDKIRLEFYPKPPVVVYGFNPDEEYLFSFNSSGPSMMGGPSLGAGYFQ